jgi:outer membrane protein assembly factor BamB
MHRAVRAAATCALIVVALSPAGAADRTAGAPGWPQFRGPERTGVASGSPIAPSSSTLSLRWRIDVGPALSTAAVRDGRVYTAVSDETTEYLAAFDAADGKELWKTPVGEVFVSEFGNGPRATPTLDGDLVYLLGGKGRLVAARAETGEVAWSVEATGAFGAEVPRFGYSGSALILGDTLIQEVGGKDGATLVFLDKRTGERKSGALEGAASYSSPFVTTLAGQRQIVLARGRTVLGLDLDGTELWRHSVEGGVIAMPVPVGGDRLFVSAGDDTGCTMLAIRKGDDGFAVEELWKNRAMRNHFNSSVVVGDTIYGFDNATLKAVSVETGEIAWAKRGLGKGSLAASGGFLAVLTDKGVVKLVRATPESYQELASVQAMEGKSWTSPSIVGNRVYVRNLNHLACVEVGG